MRGCAILFVAAGEQMGRDLARASRIILVKILKCNRVQGFSIMGSHHLRSNRILIEPEHTTTIDCGNMAYFNVSTPNMMRTFGGRFRRSPFYSVRSLLSSKTLGDY